MDFSMRNMVFPDYSRFSFLFIDDHGHQDGQDKTMFYKMTGVKSFCSMHWTSIVDIQVLLVASILSSRASNFVRHMLLFLGSHSLWVVTFSYGSCISSERTNSPLNINELLGLRFWYCESQDLKKLFRQSLLCSSRGS